MLSRDLGIDLGTSSVLIYAKKRGIVLREPSVAVLDRRTGEILEVGEEARKMLGRTPGGIAAIHPLKDGVINDYEVTERMLRELIRRLRGSTPMRPNVIISVPSGITEVEERAVVDAGLQAGARHVYLIEEVLAAALGAGLDIDKPHGCMIADVGGGVTDIAVLSMGAVVSSGSVKAGGDRFDEALVRYVRRKHNLLIGDRMAEEIKIGIGCVYPRPEEKVMEVKGRCLLTGLPRSVEISSSETMEAFDEPCSTIVDGIHAVLESTPPELVADIATSGLMLSGGGCLLWGFDRMITERTGIPARIADDAVSCVAYGAGKALENLRHMSEGTQNFARRRQLSAESSL